MQHLILDVASLKVSRCRKMLEVGSDATPEGKCNTCYHRDTRAKSESPSTATRTPIQVSRNRFSPSRDHARTVCVCPCTSDARTLMPRAGQHEADFVQPANPPLSSPSGPAI